MAVTKVWWFLLLAVVCAAWEVAECARLLKEKNVGVREEVVAMDDAAGFPVMRHAFANRKLLALVPEVPLVLDYHGGPVLTSGDGVKVYVLWYGCFTKPQKHTIVDFLRSFSGPIKSRRGATVREWWSLVSGYKKVQQQGGEDSQPQQKLQLQLAGQMQDRRASLGKSLKKSDLAALVRDALEKKVFPADENSVVLVLTAKDVAVEDFCESACGTHSYVKAGNGVRVPYAWVGNAEEQCAGMCAWPFAKLTFPGAPDTAPLVAPNGDVGADGMVINIGVVLAGAVTNPLGTGFYQGDARFPMEAATACSGTFGPGAYPGWPGDLLQDPVSGASHNTTGIKNRKFLLPALWNPSTRKCALAP